MTDVSDEKRRNGRAAFGAATRASGYVEDGPAVAVPSAEPEPVDEVTGTVKDAGDGDSSPESRGAVPWESPELRDLAALGAADETRVARTGFRGLLARLGIRVAPGAAELRAIEEATALQRFEDTIRQTTWTRPVGVLVANKKGGSGKTPSALLLGGTIAAVRGGGVAIIDGADDAGQLTFRSEGSPTRGVGELVRDLGTITSRGQLSGYTAPQTSFANVIGTVGRRRPLSHDDVVGVAAIVDEFFEIRIMDSGNQPSSSAFQGAVETADVLVVPLLNAGDAAMDAVETLEAMRSQGGRARELAERAIMLRLTDGRPEHPQVIERIGRLLASTGIPDDRVYEIPYDAHIAERGELTLAKLAPATRARFTAAAAGIVRALQEAAQ